MLYAHEIQDFRPTGVDSKRLYVLREVAPMTPGALRNYGPDPDNAPMDQGSLGGYSLQFPSGISHVFRDDGTLGGVVDATSGLASSIGRWGYPLFIGNGSPWGILGGEAAQFHHWLLFAHWVIYIVRSIVASRHSRRFSR